MHVRRRWAVDLGGWYRVSSVRVWNRQDCCFYRLEDYEIRAGPYAVTSDADAVANITKNTRVGGNTGAESGKGPFAFTTDVVARYVTLQKLSPAVPACE